MAVLKRGKFIGVVNTEVTTPRPAAPIELRITGTSL